MSALLSAAGVGKDYAKVDSRGGRLKLVWDLLRGRPAAHVFRALDGVDFELARGESLGVIGENGAGKSTLLKIVAGVIAPTRGSIAVNGRVGALLDGRLALQWGDAVALAVAVAAFLAGRWIFRKLSPNFEDFV